MAILCHDKMTSPTMAMYLLSSSQRVVDERRQSIQLYMDELQQRLDFYDDIIANLHTSIARLRKEDAFAPSSLLKKLTKYERHAYDTKLQLINTRREFEVEAMFKF